MPGPSFATGLTEGLLKGFGEFESKKSEAETQQKSQDLERYTKIATSADMPDDTRQWALQNIQTIMQGKKAGAKGGGPLSPILQQLHKLIGASHKPQGGMTENLPNGQPAPGTAGSMPTNIAPNGRPTLQGTGPAAGDPQSQPGVAPAPQTRAPQQTGNPLDAQIQQAQKALEAAKASGNGFTVKRAQDALEALQDAKSKGDAADYYADKKFSREEAGKEALQKLKDQAASDKQEMIDRHKKELEDAKLEGSKALEVAKAQHAKELKELADKDAAELKKYIQAHAPKKPAPGGGNSKLSAVVESKHQADYERLNRDVATKTAAAGKLVGAAKVKALQAVADFQKSQQALIEADYKQKIDKAGGNTGGSSSGEPPKKKEMTNSKGVTFRVGQHVKDKDGKDQVIKEFGTDGSVVFE